MAAGTKSDFQIFEEQFFGGATETLQQHTNAFNEASRGALRAIPRFHRGDYLEESVIKSIANLITRRDITSVSAATDLKVEQFLERAVKLNRKIGPVAQTLDAWRKIQRSPEDLSYVVGQQAGKGMAVEMLNTMISCLVAAVGGETTLVHDYSPNGTLVHKEMVKGLKLFGDAGDQIVCWVMHSAVYYDLVGNAISENVYDVGSLAIKSGTTPTLDRPVVVTDSSSLVVSGTPDVYYTLGLTADAAAAMESEERELVSDVVTGLENLVGRIQGEYCYTAALRGFQWDATNGGVNPSDAALATGSNWDKVVSDDKQCPGILIKSQ